eukprot:m.55 g.55  ORF g.55 m.55 type:complete len:53 (-) comp30_c1_seq1:69-227(-)
MKVSDACISVVNVVEYGVSVMILFHCEQASPLTLLWFRSRVVHNEHEKNNFL